MKQYDFDLLVVCPECFAAIGKPCTQLVDVVHFGRRIRRLLKERGATLEDLASAIETDKPLRRG